EPPTPPRRRGGARGHDGLHIWRRRQKRATRNPPGGRRQGRHAPRRPDERVRPGEGAEDRRRHLVRRRPASGVAGEHGRRGRAVPARAGRQRRAPRRALPPGRALRHRPRLRQGDRHLESLHRRDAPLGGGVQQPRVLPRTRRRRRRGRAGVHDRHRARQRQRAVPRELRPDARPAGPRPGRHHADAVRAQPGRGPLQRRVRPRGPGPQRVGPRRVPQGARARPEADRRRAPPPGAGQRDRAAGGL
ncbi:MAG: hypothetical protein AVDCRST_MAG64-1249, partial [uncultured Phycisphaerae bacterium]